MARKGLLRWLPAVLVMAAIFGFSSIPSREMPALGIWDAIIQKGGHVLGYAILALTYWYALRSNKPHWLLALFLSVVYALSDEFHQSFIPGRHAGLADVLVFDTGGAVIALGLAYWWWQKRALIKNE
jgi:VanZ family protein